MSGPTARYVLKPDPHSSHSIILRWLGQGNGRRLLDVGAADALLSRKLTERGWRVTAVEGDPALAQVGAQHCERMVVANLDREIPLLDGPFDAIVYADVLEHLTDPLRVISDLDRHLAPDGFVIVSVPNIAHLYIRLLLLFGRFDYIDRGIPAALAYQLSRGTLHIGIEPATQPAVRRHHHQQCLALLPRS